MKKNPKKHHQSINIITEKLFDVIIILYGILVFIHLLTNNGTRPGVGATEDDPQEATPRVQIPSQKEEAPEETNRETPPRNRNVC